jgi:GntR family transcriptional regulator, transcriptional repressor for pyruvate dehydrogenase complex
MSDSTPPLGAVDPRPRLSDRVAQQILDTIISRRLRPGDALPPERELVEQFGVSRTVVREAVRALDARGLVDVHVGSRIKVAAVDPKTVSDAIVNFVRSRELDGRAIADVIAALDPAIAGLAAQRATDQDLDRIATALARVGDETVARTPEAAAFEEAVIAATHNDLLIALARALASIQPAASRNRVVGYATGDYHALAEAISRRDAEGARRGALQDGEHWPRGSTVER